jgi:hypothetical protein
MFKFSVSQSHFTQAGLTVNIWQGKKTHSGLIFQSATKILFLQHLTLCKKASVFVNALYSRAFKKWSTLRKYGLMHK